jgi:hypothetical protein
MTILRILADIGLHQLEISGLPEFHGMTAVAEFHHRWWRPARRIGHYSLIVNNLTFGTGFALMRV